MRLLMSVVLIEAFHLLSVSYQSSGEKEKALKCLDRVEAYMKEQHDRDNELFSNVMNRLSSGEDVFTEGGALSVLEGTVRPTSGISFAFFVSPHVKCLLTTFPYYV